MATYKIKLNYTLLANYWQIIICQPSNKKPLSEAKPLLTKGRSLGGRPGSNRRPLEPQSSAY